MSSCLSIEGETGMLGSVWGKSLRDVRRPFFWWALGLVGLVALMISVYPSVRGNRSLNQLVNDYPDAPRDSSHSAASSTTSRAPAISAVSCSR